jgi:hypothetical protein
LRHNARQHQVNDPCPVVLARYRLSVVGPLTEHAEMFGKHIIK